MKTEFGVYGSHSLISQAAHYVLYISKDRNTIKHTDERLTSFLSVVYGLNQTRHLFNRQRQKKREISPDLSFDLQCSLPNETFNIS